MATQSAGKVHLLINVCMRSVPEAPPAKPGAAEKLAASFKTMVGEAASSAGKENTSFWDAQQSRPARSPAHVLPARRPVSS